MLVLNSPTEKWRNSDLTLAEFSKNPGAHIKPNLITEEYQALTQLREDTSRGVLTADKGVAMVIMEKPDYTNKALALLEDTNTYRVLNKDPTTKSKNKLKQTLKDIKNWRTQQQKIQEIIPNQCCCPNFLWPPQIP